MKIGIITYKETRVFHLFFMIVWGMALSYIVLYSTMIDAHLAKYVLILGAFVFQPLTILFKRLGWLKVAKIFWLATCNFYIYVTSLAFAHETWAELYYFVTAILPLVIFKPQDRKLILSTALFAPACWLLTIFLGAGFVPENLVAKEAPIDFLRTVNFMGAWGVVLIFAVVFRRSSINAQTLLEEAQFVAKIGNWSYNLSSHYMSWSQQMFLLFPKSSLWGSLKLESHLSSIHPDDRDLWQASINKCMLDGERYELKIRTLTKTGHQIWLHGIGYGRLDKNGSVTDLAGTYQNITNLVLAEERIQHERSKALHAAKLASLGELSAGVAHEINNPLTILSSGIRILSKTYGDKEKAEKKMESMQKACLRIQKIVLGLKKFARASEGAQYEKHDLSLIVEETVLLTTPKARRNGAEIRTNLQEGMMIQCDELEIEQVLINLVNNAIDAVKDQNPDNRWVEISLRKDADWIVARVMDSGPGLADSAKDKLFQPFFTTKPQGEGTGLGLPIVKGILEEHGAKIELDETSPHTCFKISFPRYKELAHVA